MNKGKATPAELQGLWQAVLNDLLRSLSKVKVPAEKLQIARGFLNDSRYVSPKVATTAGQRQLARLDRLYHEGLVAALKNRPTAAVLAETRQFRQQLERQQLIVTTADELPELPPMAPLKPQ